jgi:hypothetical protein
MKCGNVKCEVRRASQPLVLSPLKKRNPVENHFRENGPGGAVRGGPNELGMDLFQVG